MALVLVGIVVFDHFWLKSKDKEGPAESSQASKSQKSNPPIQKHDPSASHPSRPAPSRGGEMIAIPGGIFTTGPGGRSSRTDARTVEVSAFWLDKTEVTVASYKQCVDAGACSSEEMNRDIACNWGKENRSNHPINCVDWDQASAFCKWAGKRLPTNKEWEFAARNGPERRTYPWGNEAPARQLCWFETSDGGTCEAGRFPSGNSAQGVEDLAGNVKEWTCNQKVHEDECAGDEDRSDRIVRGGSWFDKTASMVQGASNTIAYAPHIRSFSIGFRCAWSSL